MFDFLLNHTPLLYLTQSLWRDEAYSVLLSQHSILQIIKLTAQDFNPPLYYLILHFWMNLFGNSEIAIRMLSFLFHLGLVYVCYLFAKKLKFSRFFIFYFLFSIFLNPMLIYYGFEARMYSLLALLATASMYFFYSALQDSRAYSEGELKQGKRNTWTYTKNRLGYIISTALGLWTQPFMIFIPLCQAAFLIFTKKFSRFHSQKSSAYFFNFLFSFLIFLPWIPTLFSQFLRSSSSWLWPISASTLTTILGSLFTGYEGTPDGLWGLMIFISSIIFIASLRLVLYDKVGRRQHVEIVVLILSWIYIPTLLVLFVSIFKPIYVNRYLIFVSVAEVFLIITVLSLIKNSSVRFLLTACYFLLSTYLLFQSVSFHQKPNIRLTMEEINYLAKPDDMILAQTPLIVFEAKYYSRDQNQVFLYNPKRTSIPDYVGKNLIDEIKQTTNFPIYPGRAFLIHEDTSYEMVYQK